MRQLAALGVWTGRSAVYRLPAPAEDGLATLTRIAVDSDKKVHAKVPAELRKALDDSSSQVRGSALQAIAILGASFDQLFPSEAVA